MSERQLKQWIEDAVSGMEARIIAKISARIDSEIRKLKQEQINNPSQGNELALATKKAAELATIDVMEKKYMPKIQAFVDDIKERTLDGGDLINEYRKRVVGGEAHKALMNTTAADFRRHAFVFKEDD